MKSSNYLVDFLCDLNELISEIDKLNSKQRLYQKNCEVFGMAYDVRFSISVAEFVKLREYLHSKIESGNAYDKKVVNLKREFSRNKPYLMIKIEQEILRIEEKEKAQINKLVYKAIYQSKIENELNQMGSYLRESNLIEKFLGVAKYRKLMVRNHELKRDLIIKEHDNTKYGVRTPFELVNLIENTDYKSGELLCIQEDIIKYFMLDRSLIKRNNNGNWKAPNLIPAGFFEKKAYYKFLNKNIEKENEELEEKIENTSFIDEMAKTNISNNLIILNSKLGKILKGDLQRREA